VRLKGSRAILNESIASAGENTDRETREIHTHQRETDRETERERETERDTQRLR
jgi:hypothetical protein